jgi:hypothetical protein
MLTDVFGIWSLVLLWYLVLGASAQRWGWVRFILPGDLGSQITADRRGGLKMEEEDRGSKMRWGTRRLHAPSRPCRGVRDLSAGALSRGGGERPCSLSPDTDSDTDGPL